MSTVTGNNSLTNASSTSQALTIPTGALAGHLWYVGMQESSTTVTISNLNGFTQEALLLPSGGNTTLFVLSRILSAADITAGSVTVTMSGAVTTVYVGVSIADTQTGAFKIGSATTAVNSGAATVTCTEVTPLAENSRLLMIGCEDNNTLTIVSWSSPLTTLDQEADTRRLGIATGVQTAAGGSGSKVLTFSNTGRTAAYLVALRNGPTRGRGMLLGVGS